ncbi:hypothetical protein P691DRAFT_368710 [Macrolepiota fuliginosa MF-IS2]|uniref:Uncharacterized protein n=1 Tax=Macrolepiota fuliginosa MF-IS2 TaxID=1400762 RepID=A0A9P5X3Y3_9AGAR|nr:hypothetical protein P691DRAFT_368710 [Macrolepiota fuliginosa MF-IS2]
MLKFNLSCLIKCPRPVKTSGLEESNTPRSPDETSLNVTLAWHDRPITIATVITLRSPSVRSQVRTWNPVQVVNREHESTILQQTNPLHPPILFTPLLSPNHLAPPLTFLPLSCPSTHLLIVSGLRTLKAKNRKRLSASRLPRSRWMIMMLPAVMMMATKTTMTMRKKRMQRRGNNSLATRMMRKRKKRPVRKVNRYAACDL